MLILLLDLEAQESTISSQARRTKKAQWLQRALLFCDYLAGKRIMALKDTEVPGSNPDSGEGVVLEQSQDQTEGHHGTHPWKLL